MKFWRFEWWGWKWVMKGINPAPSLNLNESYIFQYFRSIFKIIVVHFSIFSLNLQNYCCTFFNIFIQSLKKLYIFQYFQSSNWVLYVFQYFHSITERCLWFSSSIFSFKFQNNLFFFLNIFIKSSKECYAFFSIFTQSPKWFIHYSISSSNLQNDFIHFLIFPLDL